MTDYDLNFNKTAERFFAACGIDSFCSSKLGTEPWKRVAALYANIDQGHCDKLGSPQVVRGTLRQMAGQLLDDWNSRILIPAIFYRAERCTSKDSAALAHLYRALTDRPSPTQPSLQSPQLFFTLTV